MAFRLVAPCLDQLRYCVPHFVIHVSANYTYIHTYIHVCVCVCVHMCVCIICTDMYNEMGHAVAQLVDSCYKLEGRGFDSRLCH
jgi:hypothetical protein